MEYYKHSHNFGRFSYHQASSQSKATNKGTREKPGKMTSTPPLNVDQATQTTLLAIQALFHDPDAQAKKRANEWLSEFQHTVSAAVL